MGNFCDECGGGNLSLRWVRKDGDKDVYEVECRDCWETWEEYEDDYFKEF